MNAYYETPSRCSATGLATACILVTMLTAAASLLFTPDVPAPDASAAVSAAHVAQSHRPNQIKRS